MQTSKKLLLTIFILSAILITSCNLPGREDASDANSTAVAETAMAVFTQAAETAAALSPLSTATSTGAPPTFTPTNTFAPYGNQYPHPMQPSQLHRGCHLPG